MSQYQEIHRRQLEPLLERAIRLCLRSLGVSAFVICLLFWLSLLIQG